MNETYAKWRQDITNQFTASSVCWFVAGGVENTSKDEYGVEYTSPPCQPVPVKVAKRDFDKDTCEVTKLKEDGTFDFMWMFDSPLFNVFESEEKAKEEYLNRRAIYSARLLNKAMETIDHEEIRQKTLEIIEKLNSRNKQVK